ncbi:hypothetical protein GCG54_00011196 [Colletotrichum gloeosporioides]|uniref:Uncharacterized protein n=1 Tax=Colletotrichum gloeosporioides TaxID=474922 RepID=A0A8H4CS07_COLGL|nr:uncharacterized protein GCG54_00011196 [Colletotrichum gloeosporioides]KAF3809004.1 hypothetical protein GCG54_00011196 [Colletotrichum gloeosporioides]
MDWSGHQAIQQQKTRFWATFFCNFLLQFFLRWKWGRATITEKGLTAAATNAKIHTKVLKVMFYKRTGSDLSAPWVEDQTQVTDQVLKTAYQNLPDSEGRSILYRHMESRGMKI